LLLSIDPLAALAEVQTQLRDRLMELAPSVSPELEAAWQAAAGAVLADEADKQALGEAVLPEQYYLLVTCRDERHQVELLTRFQAEGLTSKAVLS
jgi:hypothetical protein